MLGKRLGLPLETIHEIVGNSSGNSYAFSAKMEKFIMADQYEGGFATELQLKDLNLALDAAKETQDAAADGCGCGADFWMQQKHREWQEGYIVHCPTLGARDGHEADGRAGRRLTAITYQRYGGF